MKGFQPLQRIKKGDSGGYKFQDMVMPTENDELGSGDQLRVRISIEEKAAIDKVRRERGWTISDVVREALGILKDQHEGKTNSELEKKIANLATLLKREPEQVRNACLQGIFDLIENKTRTPLIVMESELYSSYGKAATVTIPKQ
jgi:hypothetical protein